MPGTTVAATVLFTDLVDSTRLSTSLSADAADNLRQRHFSLLRGAVASHGGTEVKNLGDGLMVVLPGPSAALDCAVDMQRAIARSNVGTEVALSVRIGVATGEATAEDGDFFGEPVVEAARLCAAAGGGQILTTALVRATLGRRAAHRLDLVGELELKGLPEPVEAWEVHWAPTAETPAVPLPARWRDLPAVGFVGRDDERALLAAAWKEVTTGGRRVVLVAGEPGIGKTRLARETALGVAEHGAVVLFGGCDEGLGAPYRPWIEALGHLVAHLPAPVLDSVGPRRLADLARVVPVVHDRVADLAGPAATDAETERYLFYAAVAALLSAATAIGPIFLTIDDLQWADRQSLDLLRHVVAAQECHSLLIVATFRDADVGSDHPLADVLAALRREPDVMRVALSGLDDHDLVALLDSAAHEPLGAAGDELARALYRETDGNPFFAWEVMRHLAETGWAVQDQHGHWVSRDLEELSLPESVREVVGRRVARLGTETNEVLAVAAVLGADFDLAALAATLGRADVDVLARLEHAEQAGLVRSVAAGRFRFGHAIIRHTLYDQLNHTRRALVHRRAAEAIEALGPQPGRSAELARHWAAAVTQADPDKAISYSRRAGDEALASLAPDQAAEHYRRALDLFEGTNQPDDTLRCELMCSVAEALCQSGDPAYEANAIAAARLAQRLGSSDLLVRAALVHYRVASSAYDAERCAILEAALTAVGPGDSEARVRLSAELSHQLTFADGPRAYALGEEARAIARRLGDRRLLLHTVANHFGFLWDVDGLEPALEGVQLAVELDDPVGMALAGECLFQDAIVWGDRSRAEEGLALFERGVARVGRPDLRWIFQYCRADWACLEGRLDECEALIDVAWDVALRTGQPGARLVRAAQTLMVRWHQGRPADAAPLLAEAAAEDRNFAMLHLDDNPGSPEGLARAVEQLPRDGAWLGALSILAEQVARAGDRALMDAVYDELLPHRHKFNKQGPQTRGPVAHTLALLADGAGRSDVAAEDFAAADDLNDRLRFPFYTARTRVDWARFLIREGSDPARARDLGESALDISMRYGYTGLERRARRLLGER